ncbi:carbon-nitrogen hydrolase family protein [Candidatus Formimonas warabiya]|uniref:carbon-nitrogen hydrolase family protein n=1 Tax=Formimonas warabiya TaxID=1761012 RepID=UPI001BE4DD71|nr:carbon-nitrogen hydrolase family protein [Candidatus Formimonas warabiya]
MTNPFEKLPEKLTLGMIQFQAHPGKVDLNLQEAEMLIGQAAAQGAQIVLLPELWAIGYGIENPQAYAEKIPGIISGFMSDQAKKHGIYLAGGFPEKGQEDRCYDAAILVNPQGIPILVHRKVHLYCALGEDKIWHPGNSFQVVQTEIGRIGMLICYDGDFPESWRILALKGADLILHPTAYESPCETFGWWTKLYEAAALVNGVWCASANMVGDTPDKTSHFFGWSRIITPMGETISQASYIQMGEKCQSEVLVTTVPFAAGLRNSRTINGCFLADRKPEVYQACGLGK